MRPATRSHTESFPWRAPRHERLILVLVALAALTPIYGVTAQDVSRLCLSRSVLAGRLTIDHCVGRGTDRARYGGHLYSDKAPGLSLIALPAVLATRLPSPAEWRVGRDLRVWVTRLLTNGLAFIVLVWALGRIAEGLRRGTGPPVAVTFALGTLAGGLAATTFDQVTAATLGFAGFALAWRSRPGWAGVCAGLAFLVEYQAILVVLPVAAYVVFRRRRDAARFLVGALPGVVVLGAYDWAAFGSPLHASYRYVANGYARSQAAGFFGISLPRGHAVWQVLVGDRGLLVASPVLVVAAAGLVLLGRERRLEALLCGTVTALYVMLEFGYFLPYGGVSPGPRFLLPALPFLALGLAPMFARRRRLTVALAIPSIVASMALALTWSWGSVLGYRQTIWGELLRSAFLGATRLRHDLAGNVLTTFGVGRVGAAFAVAACSGLALLTALRAQRVSRGAAPTPPIGPLDIESAPIRP